MPDRGLRWVCYPLPQGPNPNYVGPASPYEGGSTDGSNYVMNFDVPVCYASDDNTDSKGLQLEIINIPHHSFADPLKVGKAIVTVSSGKTFRQSNQFQLWHKNTMHLGLTVMRDANEEIVSAEPFFSNFQYDGRTDLGREEDMMGEMLELQRNAKLLLGDEYDGLSEEDASIVDLAVATGLVSTVPVPGYGKRFGEVTPSDIVLWKQTVSSDYVSFRMSEDAWRSGLGRRSLGQADATKTHRRKLNGHDEWGAVNLALRLGRFADVYTKGHEYSVWNISSDVGGMSSTIIGFLGFALAVFETLKELSGANHPKQQEEDADEEKQQP